MKKCCVIALVILQIFSLTACKSNDYNNALKLMRDGKYESAIIAFEELGDYKDSLNKIEECRQAMVDAVYADQYNAALALKEAGKYAEAGMAFYAIKEY